MTSVSEEKEFSYNIVSSVREALPHLIRLEAFFRAREIDGLSTRMDEVLCEAERLLSMPVESADGLAGAPSPTDRDQPRYNAG